MYVFKKVEKIRYMTFFLFSECKHQDFTAVCCNFLQDQRPMTVGNQTDQITSGSKSFYNRNSSLNLQIYFPLEVLFATHVDCTCSREMGIAKSNSPDQIVFCVYRGRILTIHHLTSKPKMHKSHPQALPYQYHQLYDSTLNVLFARDRAQNRWLYQLVLGINCFWTNLPYFLSEQDVVQVICLTIIFITMLSNRFLQLEQHQISITQV